MPPRVWRRTRDHAAWRLFPGRRAAAQRHGSACCDELAWRVEKCRACQITFGIESHIGSLVPFPKSAARLVRCVPGLTLTLDYTHYGRQGSSGRRGGAAAAICQPFSCAWSTPRPPSDVVREEHDRLSPHCSRHAGSGLCRLDWHRVHLDRLEHGNENDCLSETIRFRTSSGRCRKSWSRNS